MPFRSEFGGGRWEGVVRRTLGGAWTSHHNGVSFLRLLLAGERSHPAEGVGEHHLKALSPRGRDVTGGVSKMVSQSK